MHGRLQGKVALITGGCSGIGLGMAELFIAEGAKVVVADINGEAGAALEPRFAGDLAFAPCDVTREADIVAALARAMSAFGGLDILVNNAGGSGAQGGVKSITAEGWDATFALNVRSAALGIHHAYPLLKERGGGSIISTASVAGLQAGYGQFAYSRCKAAVIHLSRCAAADLAADNIRVNAICPGAIVTEAYVRGRSDTAEGRAKMFGETVERAVELQPIKKPGLAEDVARVAFFLASDESVWVTGTHIVVDGGLTVGPRHAWDPTTPKLMERLFPRPTVPR
jgi:NAD(P)-dependent dehydrogenase (short-subunit alcohol dehydrogenase family)